MAVRTVSPDGTAWVVRRRWLPGTSTDSITTRFGRRFRRVAERSDGLDVDPGCGEVLGEGIAAAIALIAIVLLLLAGAILVARVVLRRPWIVEAVDADGDAHRWDVVGWRASGAACTTVAQHLEAGLAPAAIVLV